MIRRGVGNILGKSKQNQEKEQSSTKGNKVNKIKGELIDGFFFTGSQKYYAALSVYKYKPI